MLVGPQILAGNLLEQPIAEKRDREMLHSGSSLRKAAAGPELEARTGAVARGRGQARALNERVPLRPRSPSAVVEAIPRAAWTRRA